MIVIYRNPGSPSTKDCLEILETKKADHKAVKYLDEPLTVEKLTKVIKILDLNPIEIVRKQEKLWKENFEGIEINDKDLIELLIEYPALIKLPIIINGNKAIIGKTSEKVLMIV